MPALRSALTSLRAQASATLGAAASVALAPPFAAMSALRKARVFHPRGVVVAADVVPASVAWPRVAERLAGPAVVRLSPALHASPDGSVDLLGCAIRLLPPWEAASEQDATQDLLMVTSRSLVQLPLGLFTTRTADFLVNDYYSITPFEVDGIGVGYLRLRGGAPRAIRTLRGRGDAVARLDALARALGEDTAIMHLEMRGRGLGRTYEALADIRLRFLVDLDQEALAFSPFRTGRGIRPRGFINGLRRATYPASARARRWRREGRAEARPDSLTGRARTVRHTRIVVQGSAPV